MQTKRQCPDCGSTDLRHSHRIGLGDWALHCVGGRIYRCRVCRCRFRTIGVVGIWGWKNHRGPGGQLAWRRGALLTLGALAGAGAFLFAIASKLD
jgi:hypothetical protein